MKNEDKLVELLAESLKKQDQMIEQMSGMNNRLASVENKMDKQEGLLNRLVHSMNNLTDIVQIA